MKIDSSAIGMESVRTYRSSRSVAVSFGIMQYPQDAENKETKQKSESDDKKEIVSLKEWQNRFGITRRNIVDRPRREENTEDDIRQATVRYIFDLLFRGRRERFQNHALTKQEVSQESATWQRFVEIREEESESVSFQTKGMVKTADGRTIQFDVDFSMSQSFQNVFVGRESAENNMATAIAMCDPLVINLDHNVASLSDQHFFFDIDCDGVEDELSNLSAGNGFLALDKNNDGIINDGSELFGAKSGNGFADLSAYDEDKNGWIDENDAIWSKLKIWCINSNGEPQLYGLSEKGVGAICLANVGTDMSLRGQDGQLQGAMRKSGVFLYENGDVGMIQHLDLAKYGS